MHHQDQARTEPLSDESRWELLAGVIATAALSIAVLFAGMGHFYEFLQGPCPYPCADERLTVTQWMRAHQAGISPRTYAEVFAVLAVALAVVCLIAAVILIWKRPRDRMSYLVGATLILLGESYSEADTLATLNQFALVNVGAALEAIALIAFLAVMYVFPGGRFYPRWTRWLLLLSGAIILFMRSAQGQALHINHMLIAAMLVIPPLLAQIARYRHASHSAERHQVKWAAYGLVMALSANFLSTIADAVFGVGLGVAPAIKLAMEALAYFGMMLIPVTMVAALLRYRLYDINVIIRRTLQYALVALLLTLAYTGILLLLQSLLRDTIRRGDSLAVILATLAIVALYGPVRQRVQVWVDRRFYPSAYRSEEVVASFGRMAQNESDLGKLTDEMMDAVRSAVHPSYATLWLSQPTSLPRDGES